MARGGSGISWNLSQSAPDTMTRICVAETRKADIVLSPAPEVRRGARQAWRSRERRGRSRPLSRGSGFRGIRGLILRPDGRPDAVAVGVAQGIDALRQSAGGNAVRVVAQDARSLAPFIVIESGIVGSDCD